MIRDIAHISSYALLPRTAQPAEAPQTPAIPVDRVDLDNVLATTASDAEHLATKLPEHREGEVLVKVKPGMDLNSLASLANEYEAEVLHRFDIPKSIYQTFGGDLLQLKLPQGMSTAQAIAAMERDDRIAYAASNDIVHGYGSAEPVIPDDLHPKLWGLNNANGIDIDAPEAWSITTGDRVNGPVIAVIDTGVDYTHVDLQRNMWTNPGEIPDNGIDDDGNGVIDDVHGYNAITGSGNPMDDNMHGTHCSGTIAADGNNGTGVVGVAWEGQIMGAKFLSGSGSGTTADAIKAVLYATKMGARITSNSWGGGGFSQPLYDAMAASPALHICAAGNSSANNDRSASYPANYDLPNLISVAAVTSGGSLASFSNYGHETVHIAAPGAGIYSTVPGNKYRSLDGTSMACPHVAGVAGLIATEFPDASNAEIKARLLGGAETLRSLEGRVASGMLNAARSLETDTTAPGMLTDLAGQARSPRLVELGWTAPGDDGLEGTVSGYEVRVSDEPITDAQSFLRAMPLAAPAPQAAGENQSLTVNLPLAKDERNLHFAVRSYDNVANMSDIATTTVAVPGAHLAFNGDGFSPEGEWGQVDVDGRAGVWTDSPDGNYQSRTDAALISPEFSLKGLSGSSLVFDSKFELENGEDKVVVEVQDGSWFGWWHDAAEFTGTSDWGTRTVDLSDYDGKDVKIRFRMSSDRSANMDGFYLDKVAVLAEPPA